MSLSCLSDRYSIETRLWLDELKKILFRMINTACLSQDLERAFVREKNGVTAPVGACKVFLRLRCFAQHFCVSFTHTHTCLSYHFHPVTMICGGEILHALSTCLATATATSSTPQQAARRAAGFSGSCCCPFTLLSLSLTAVKPAKISYTLRLWF